MNNAEIHLSHFHLCMWQASDDIIVVADDNDAYSLNTGTVITRPQEGQISMLQVKGGNTVGSGQRQPERHLWVGWRRDMTDMVKDLGFC